MGAREIEGLNISTESLVFRKDLTAAADCDIAIRGCRISPVQQNTDVRVLISNLKFATLLLTCSIIVWRTSLEGF